MSVFKSGVVIVGTVDIPVNIPAGQSLSWTHNQAKRALSVSVIGPEGGHIDTTSAPVLQPNNNLIVVSNTTAGALDVKLVVNWDYGTIGKSGEVDAGDPSISIA